MKDNKKMIEKNFPKLAITNFNNNTLDTIFRCTFLTGSKSSSRILYEISTKGEEVILIRSGRMVKNNRTRNPNYNPNSWSSSPIIYTPTEILGYHWVPLKLLVLGKVPTNAIWTWKSSSKYFPLHPQDSFILLKNYIELPKAKKLAA